VRERIKRVFAYRFDLMYSTLGNDCTNPNKIPIFLPSLFMRIKTWMVSARRYKSEEDVRRGIDSRSETGKRDE